MTTAQLGALVSAARERASRFSRCSVEQALTYACEDTVDDQLPTRTLDLDVAARVLDTLCHAEDLDPPLLEKGRARRSLASADLEAHAICMHRSSFTMLTLVHEIAHLSSRAESHGVLFRDEMVRLVRAHVGIEHAALLFGLYTGCGLEMSPWAASAQRPGLPG